MFEPGDIVAVKIDDEGNIDAKSVGMIAKILPANEWDEAATIRVSYRKPYNYNSWGVHAPKNLVKLTPHMIYHLWGLEDKWKYHENIIKKGNI